MGDSSRSNGSAGLGLKQVLGGVLRRGLDGGEQAEAE